MAIPEFLREALSRLLPLWHAPLKLKDPFFLLSFPFFFCSCLPQQASRCFLPSAALLCPSPPPISRLKKRKKKKTKKLPPTSQPQGGSTNMPLFGRVHECKEYEYWNEKKV